jgi:predicted O-methyltransferase YrrM
MTSLTQTHWQQAFDTLVAAGLPAALLRNMCISPEEAALIDAVIEQRRPQNVLEIGTFVGLSTGVIALACGGGASLVCIDPDLPVGVQASDELYLASLPAPERTPQPAFAGDQTALSYVRRVLAALGLDAQATLRAGFFSCYPQQGFMDQLTRLGIEPQHMPLVGAQLDCAPFDLVFVDGDHHPEAVYSDLRLCSAFLSQRGLIILHDVAGAWGERVRAGIDRFVAENPGYAVEVRGNLGFVERRQTV